MNTGDVKLFDLHVLLNIPDTSRFCTEQQVIQITGNIEHQNFLFTFCLL